MIPPGRRLIARPSHDNRNGAVTVWNQAGKSSNRLCEWVDKPGESLECQVEPRLQLKAACNFPYRARNGRERGLIARDQADRPRQLRQQGAYLYAMIEVEEIEQAVGHDAEQPRLAHVGVQGKQGIGLQDHRWLHAGSPKRGVDDLPVAHL